MQNVNSLAVLTAVRTYRSGHNNNKNKKQQQQQQQQQKNFIR